MKPHRRQTVCLLCAVSALAATFAISRAAADEIPTETLRSAAAIVAAQDGRMKTLGSAFFVEVPSKQFSGSSFVYLVTARHVLIDRDGRPIPRLRALLEDGRTGMSRQEPLPDENHWLLDLKHESADVAALPFGPPTANIAPIPLSMMFAEVSEAKVGTIPASIDVGAPCYFLTAAALGTDQPRFVPLARFCRLSSAEAAEADVAGAGNQALYFVDAFAREEFIGAPVFARAGERYVLLGMMESEVAATDSTLAGLAGVMPAGYVAETVEALAAAQERKARARTIGH